MSLPMEKSVALIVKPGVRAFFDKATSNASYVVSDPETRHCAVIDSVLDFDPASGRTGTGSADRIVEYVRAQGLSVDWVLETHVHADHLTAAPFLREKLGGRTAIGEHVIDVQAYFARVFNAGPDFKSDGSQFDHLLRDGETFRIGGIEARAIHTPGHTPACMVYLVGDALFTGDTLFMPDSGTARCDFPGGSARQLYHSIQKVLALPPETRVFVNHDYGADGKREIAWETTIAAQRAGNIHVRNGTGEADYVAMREKRDASLSMPRLLLPSIQVNMRGGRLPQAESNGVRYLKIPLDLL
jgi:glyoxylase-like metal-dependent hydrolase (beta-lactamase superfamily II)